MNTYVHIYIFLSATPELRWVEVGANTMCDLLSGETYRYQSPGKVASLEACQLSCEADAECQSITYFKSKWCSHFSTACTKTKFTKKALSMRLGETSRPKTTLGATTAPQTTLGATTAPQTTLGATTAPQTTLGATTGQSRLWRLYIGRTEIYFARTHTIKL